MISEPLIKSAIEQLSIDPYDIECAQFVQGRIRSMDVEDILHPDPFRRTNPTHPNSVTGPIMLGKVRHSNTCWGIHQEALTEHFCCVGRTGGGKTTIIKSIIRQLLKFPDSKVTILDRKQDFPKFAQDNGIAYLLADDYPDFICALPDGVSARIYSNIIGEIIATQLETRIAGQILITETLCNAINDNDNLTLVHFASRLVARAEQSRGTTRDSLMRVGHQLRVLSSILGNASSSTGRSHWQALNKHSWALSLAGLSVSHQNFCIAVNFAKELLYRICNNLHSRSLRRLIVIDEASPIFPRTGTKKTALLLDYFQQARAFGIGVIFASQSMNLADEIFANTAIKVGVGGFGHGADYEAFGSAVGLNRAQREFMRTIGQPGSAIVKDIRYPHPFSVQIDRPAE
ncbi:MAG: ATP-binding protein [candidate division Zixibacteria bacterium]|nr:ATP-binding protein [candidate division Zixibacteria bacterium]